MFLKSRKPYQKHGHYGTSEYHSWGSMIHRCYNTKSSNYPSWGGRGIKVCLRWQKDFNLFYADMGPKPTPQHSLDRINSNLGYSPKNCRWANRIQQGRNTRWAILSIKKAKKIRELFQSDTSRSELAKSYGVCWATVYAVTRNMIWKEGRV